MLTDQERTPKQLRQLLKNRRRNARRKAERERRRRAILAHLPKPTAHALARWAERFRPDEAFEVAYANSAPVGWADLKRAAGAAGLVLRLRPTSEFRRDAESGAVFVIDSDGGPSGGKELRTVVRLRLNLRGA